MIRQFLVTKVLSSWANRLSNAGQRCCRQRSNRKQTWHTCCVCISLITESLIQNRRQKFFHYSYYTQFNKLFKRIQLAGILHERNDSWRNGKCRHFCVESVYEWRQTEWILCGDAHTAITSEFVKISMTSKSTLDVYNRNIPHLKCIAAINNKHSFIHRTNHFISMKL